MEIRGKTISFSSYRSKQRKDREDFIIKKIEILEKNITENNIEELHLLQQELSDIRDIKMKGSFIRSKAKWIDEGEKPTKYFCNLEKQHSSSKTIPYIINNNGHNIYDQNEILAEAASYYKTLYSKGETKESDNAIFDELNLIANISLSRFNKLCFRFP